MNPNETPTPLTDAAMKADWQQVVMNGGPPCFHIEGGRFCFRAERWLGHHGSARDHEFIGFDDFVGLIERRNAELVALLVEAGGLLVQHHEASLVTWDGQCPVCSKGHTEFYPHNIFARIDKALAAQEGGEG